MKKQISVTLSEGALEHLDSLARQADRSRSNMLEVLLREHHGSRCPDHPDGFHHADIVIVNNAEDEPPINLKTPEFWPA